MKIFLFCNIRPAGDKQPNIATYSLKRVESKVTLKIGTYINSYVQVVDVIVNNKILFELLKLGW